MTGDERERAYYAPIVVAPEREAAWARWKDDYLASCVGTWVEQGGNRQELLEAATVVLYDLSQVDDLPWMPIGQALGVRLDGMLTQGEYEGDQKVAYINALRTTQTSTEHDRALATAYQLGMTVQQVRNITAANPTGYEQEPASSDERTALYRHYDESGALLYVGIAKDPTQRGEQHRYNSKWFRFVNHTQIEWHDSRELAALAERAAIGAEFPVFNQTHNRANRGADVNYLFGALEVSSSAAAEAPKAAS